MSDPQGTPLPGLAKLKPQVQTPTDRSTHRHPVKVKAVHVNFYYAHKQALKGISMDIGERQITALIGPSGCGKSTFLRTLNRMNEFIPGARLEGEIFMDGVDIYDKSVDVNHLRRRVGMIFQRSNPLPKTIYENIAYGVRVNHMVKSRSDLDGVVEQALKAAALWDEVKDDLKKSALALSGGQQQRLCIARALAVKPDILLMDEPASALDPISTAKIEELMIELKKHYTIVIVTHNMQQAARTSDYTGFFLSGELIEFDLTAKLFTNPSRKETEDYITGRFG